MKKLWKVCTLALSFLMLFAVAGCGGQSSDQVTLRVYNWGDYIDEDVLAQFEEQNPDIHVVYDTFDSNESMLAKMDGGVQYDVLIPSDYMIEKLIQEDRLAELDLSQIPNYANIDDSFKNLAYDPDNKYSVPYTWGTLGIMYNTTMVDETVDSWNILWDEKYKGNIIMYDSSRDSMAVALRKLGYSVNTKNDAEIEAAAQALTSQKPLVKAYMTDAIKQAMDGGSAALSVVYSGDAMLCMEENPDLAYVVPKEGSNMWFDSIVVTKDCQNMDAAYRFINFLCDPEVAAKNSEYIGYSTPNKEALALMDEEMKADPAYNPPAEVVEKCEVYLDLGDKTDLYNQLWEKVKVN